MGNVMYLGAGYTPVAHLLVAHGPRPKYKPLLACTLCAFKILTTLYMGLDLITNLQCCRQLRSKPGGNETG